MLKKSMLLILFVITISVGTHPYLLMPNVANLKIRHNISQWIFQRRRAQLTKLSLQPIANRYLLYRMTQDRINIHIYLVSEIW
jgi:hypothetical protein